MASFHMDMSGTIDRFQKIDRRGAVCAIRKDGTSNYIKLPCAWCNMPCEASAENCLTDKKYALIKERMQNHNEHMKGFAKHIPMHVFSMIDAYTMNTDPEKEKYWKWAHPKCVEFSTKSKSGRTIKKIDRFQDAEFVKGAGISGCDQYDRGYDNGGHYDYETHGKRDFSSLSNFVVSDDVIEHDDTQSNNDEEEPEYDSEYSDEEEESDEEYFDDDSEDDSDDDEGETNNKIVMRCTNEGCNFSDSFNSIEEAKELEWDKDLTGDWLCAQCGIHLADILISASDDESNNKYRSD